MIPVGKDQSVVLYICFCVLHSAMFVHHPYTLEHTHTHSTWIWSPYANILWHPTFTCEQGIILPSNALAKSLCRRRFFTYIPSQNSIHTHTHTRRAQLHTKSYIHTRHGKNLIELKGHFIHAHICFGPWCYI